MSWFLSLCITQPRKYHSRDGDFVCRHRRSHRRHYEGTRQLEIVEAPEVVIIDNEDDDSDFSDPEDFCPAHLPLLRTTPLPDMTWFLSLCIPRPRRYGRYESILIEPIKRKKKRPPTAADLRARKVDKELNRRELHRQALRRLQDPIDIGRARRREEARRKDWEAMNGPL